MRIMQNSPYASVAISAVTYATIVGVSLDSRALYSHVQKTVKLISATHSVLVTLLAGVALIRTWTVPNTSSQDTTALTDSRIGRIGPGTLNDTQNPLISGTSKFANFVTAWETGYLIYDTAALILLSYWKDKSQSLLQAVFSCTRDSPIFMFHHIAIASALFYLQHYISMGREKGLQIIMAFLLMNASNPLLHLRWWRRKVTGKKDRRVETALAIVFALTRFGGVYWVMHSYGEHHHLGAWEAFRKQRLPCQLGTGLLTSVNAIWWTGLVTGIAKRKR